MTDELIFEDPPMPNAGGRPIGASPIGRFLDALRDHPGKWARFPKSYPKRDNLGHIVGDITKARRYGISVGEFEATTRKVESEYFLYVRYVGGES